MGKVLAITNRKGGCGKTMTAASLGVGLARLGQRTLVIDADSQHSLTISLGVAKPENLPVNLATVLNDIIAERDTDPMAGIIHHAEGVDLLPANNGLAAIESALSPLLGRETFLNQYISKIKAMYDYVLIDTAPALDLLAVNVLAAADSVLIPVAPRFLDAKGLELLLKSIAQIRKYINPKITIRGILLTLVDRRANFTKAIIGMINEAYSGGIHVFEDVIPLSIRAAETVATGKSIFIHDPRGKVAAAYEKLANNIVETDKLALSLACSGSGGSRE